MLGSEVSYHFDPLLAKLVTWAPDRPAAIARMKRALEDFVLLGVGNNIEFLSRIVASDDFASGKLDTGFLDRHRELFDVSDHLPAEALLVASLTGGTVHDRPAGEQAPHTFSDAWASGEWRNT
jgi:acetyl/propionyl-CoA carboxylase alpha subunit